MVLAVVVDFLVVRVLVVVIFFFVCFVLGLYVGVSSGIVLYKRRNIMFCC